MRYSPRRSPSPYRRRRSPSYERDRKSPTHSRRYSRSPSPYRRPRSPSIERDRKLRKHSPSPPPNFNKERWDHSNYSNSGRNRQGGESYNSFSYSDPNYLVNRQKERASRPMPNIWERSPSPPKLKRKRLPTPETSPKKQKIQENKKELSEKNASEEEEEYVWQERVVVPEKNTDEVIGPIPLPQVEVTSYGSALLPGEGEAMAKYVQENKRIPRRGEVGLEAEEIEQFEDLGYVMSGSRHKKMTAVRIRKENQIYSAEQQRTLALINYEERAKKENELLADFRDILASKNLISK